MSKSGSPLSTPSSDSSTPTSGSAPRLSSPLNPASTPTKGTVPLPPSSLQNVANSTKSGFEIQNRVSSVPNLSSIPNIEEVPPPLSSSPSSSTAASTPRARSAGLLPVVTDGKLSPRRKGKSRSVSKERSRSPARRDDDEEVDPSSPAEDTSLLEASWYGTKHVIHSWQEPPKRKNTKSVAHDDARETTRKVRCIHYQCSKELNLRDFISLESCTGRCIVFGVDRRCCTRGSSYWSRVSRLCANSRTFCCCKDFTRDMGCCRGSGRKFSIKFWK